MLVVHCPRTGKRTIRYAGKPIGAFLKSVVDKNDKKEVCFVASNLPLCGSSVADSVDPGYLMVSLQLSMINLLLFQ